MQSLDSNPSKSIELPLGDDRYVLRTRRDVLPVFDKLVKRPIPIEVHVAQFGTTFVSSLLAVNPAYGELVFDASGLPGAVRLDGSAGLTAEAQMDAIWFRFSSSHVQAVSGYGPSAFRARIPKEIVRLQRRDSARFPISALNPPIVDLRVSTGEEGSMRLRVIDISCSGVALLVEDPQLSIEMGRKFSDCRLHLPDIGAVSTDIEVVYLTPFGEIGERRLGGRLTNLRANALGHIERYILRLENSQQDAGSDA